MLNIQSIEYDRGQIADDQHDQLPFAWRVNGR